MPSSPSAPTPPAPSDFSPLPLPQPGLARLVSIAYPPLLLSAYAASFSSIIAAPAPALLTLLPLTAALQVFYAVLCLPLSAQNSNSKAQPAKAVQRKKSRHGDWIPRLSTALIALIISLSLGTAVLAITLVLFGAPITTHIPETLACAAHMALLAGVPLVYVHGVDAERWRAVAALLMPMDEVYGAAVGVLLGVWIGAIPIPLDWDREWQKWPCTIVTGAYLGWAAGKALGVGLRGKVVVV
ncbi:hypothetical protein EJ06DRAFT_544829 [Trichodelitschia bisporula]|uniref:Glycosylphosphatidylinositol anchor biosynthesis protein 11 n=1 Tax=Trichodelitschia bisporula TaxID=703511 RepID=A0A6G1HLK5_9PEZI|nr:hypothetical protein EJ06DRAFT_544829 [Trichodelitschia bisporula]